MYNPLSRFQRLGSLRVTPGCCYICKNNDGPFIDTGMTIAYEGALAVCHNCVVEMYQQLDLPTPAQEELEQQITSAYEAGRLIGAVETKAALDAFMATFEPPAVNLPDAPVPVAVEGDNGGKENSRKSKRGNAGPDASAVESDSTDSESGRTDVSSDSSDGESVDLNLTF